MTIERFEPRIPDATLADLHARLATARLLPDRVDDWSAGTSPVYLRQLVDYWRTGFDWRAQEAQLCQFSHFVATLPGGRTHFLHERGRGDAPLPLILTHGYPDSFYRFVKLIPLLTDPAAHGGDPRDAFDVVVPSLPGYSFSDPAAADSSIFDVADRWHELMQALGYQRYGAHGGDWGSTVTEQLAAHHPRAVVGIHLTDVPFWHAFRKPRHRTDAEDRYLAQIDRFQREDGAYAMIQARRPQTLADGLNDSPAGLAAWLVDFFYRWSDNGGDIERCFTKDELLTNVMLYWATGTIGSSFEPYRDVIQTGAARWILERLRQVLAPRVPAGFAMFPADLSSPPREWAERFFHVVRWTPMPRGGHFAALEAPELLADDIRAMFRPLRAA